MALFSGIQLANQFIHQLPADHETAAFPRLVEKCAFSFVNPTRVSKPSLVAIEDDLALSLGFSREDMAGQEFTQLFSGNKLLDGMQPFAMCYGGHQFGQWAGQLGDGRAINLAEIQTPKHGRKILQLKGAGLTPYSRTADGLAVLRSSIREFLCSEAMYHLGIPTTRALTLCLTGEQVWRDMFYDGNGAYEPGAIVCRVSSSFTRFGTFQLPAKRGDLDLLTRLVDYTITNDFPHLGKPSKEVYIAWFNEVCQRTCELIVHWMRVGFVHGVMNTDNMSILGETIDYGPYGWIDDFNLHWTPNTTDAQGKRYRFGDQGQISQWNLFQLANAIYPLIQDAAPLQKAIDDYAELYHGKWLKMMSAKLGLGSFQADTDTELIQSLEDLLGQVETDMTIFFRRLAMLPVDVAVTKNNLWLDYLSDSYYQADQLGSDYLNAMSTWLAGYIERLIDENADFERRKQSMDSVNPKYVLRNYLAQQAIDLAHQGDFSMLRQLQQVLRKPYDEQPDYQHLAGKRPDWARHKAGCSMLSCSS